MAEHFADRLIEHCARKESPICVGLDPVYSKLPATLRSTGPADPAADPKAAASLLALFCLDVIDAVADLVPCVKVQSACFERYLWHGVEAYHRVVHEAASRGLCVIGDAKRGDIGISAEHYAAGCLADHPGLRGPDALTVNSYLGQDSLEPFIKAASPAGKGLFALVRTSNPGGDAIQGLPLAQGGSVGDAVAAMVAQLGSSHVGSSGYSLLGAVVGATKTADAIRLRELMPTQMFLVPGYGAQGAGADDVRACFNPDGRGALITASRSIIYAFEKSAGDDWRSAVRAATLQMKQEIAGILG